MRTVVGTLGKSAIVCIVIIVLFFIDQGLGHWVSRTEFHRMNRFFKEHNDIEVTPEPFLSRMVYERDAELIWRYHKSNRVIFNETTRTGAKIVWTLKTNSRGFRGEFPPPYSRFSGDRIFFLGDSRTVGAGVLDRESYVNVFENLWNSRHSPGIESLNFSVDGYTSFQAAILLKKYSVYRPKIVVVSTWFNDFQKASKPLLERKGSSVKVFIDNILHRSGLFFLALRLRNTISVPDEVRHFYGGGDYPNVTPEQFRENLDEMLKTCQLLGARMVYLLIPAVDEDGTVGYGSSGYDVLVRQFCRENSIPIVETIDLFEGRPELFFDDVHPDRRGHRLIAYRLLESLQALFATID